MAFYTLKTHIAYHPVNTVLWLYVLETGYFLSGPIKYLDFSLGLVIFPSNSMAFHDSKEETIIYEVLPGSDR